MLCRARYYDPVLKRFISEDPAGLKAGLNGYRYVDNAPTEYSDPDGEIPVVPVAIAYARCIATCMAQAAAGAALFDELECFDVGDNAKDCALECLNPFNWGGKAGAKKLGVRGENAAAKRGREAHKNYEKALGDKYKYNEALPSGKRPDAVDFVNREVRELKPDNPETMKKGIKQLDGYVKELERMTGDKWKSFLDVYRR